MPFEPRWKVKRIRSMSPNDSSPWVLAIRSTIGGRSCACRVRPGRSTRTPIAAVAIALVIPSAPLGFDLTRGGGAQRIDPGARFHRVDAEGARAPCEDDQRAAGNREVLEEAHELDPVLARGNGPEVMEHQRHGNEEDQQRQRSPARLEPDDDTDATHQLENGRDREQDLRDALARGVSDSPMPGGELSCSADEEDQAESDSSDKMRRLRDCVHV